MTDKICHQKGNSLNTTVRLFACIILCCIIAIAGINLFIPKQAQALPGCDCAAQGWPVISFPTNGALFTGTVGQNFPPIQVATLGGPPPVCVGTPTPNLNVRDLHMAPYGWLDGLPPGLGITGMTIGGIPTVAGTYAVILDVAVLDATNQPCCVNYPRVTIQITINPAIPSPPAIPESFSYPLELHPAPLTLPLI